MALKDLLVYVNSSKHCAQRIDLAIGLAQAHDSHLVGLYVTPDFFVPAYAAAQLPPDVLMAQRDLLAAARSKAKAEFEERARRAGLGAEWREAEGDSGEMAALHARYADLAVVGQLDPDEAVIEQEGDVPERVMLESGRPALVIPYAGRFAA